MTNLPAGGATAPRLSAADAARQSLIDGPIATPLDARCAMAFADFMLDGDYAASVQYAALEFAFELGRRTTKPSVDLPLQFVDDQDLAAAWTAGFGTHLTLHEFLNRNDGEVPCFTWRRRRS